MYSSYLSDLGDAVPWHVGVYERKREFKNILYSHIPVDRSARILELGCGSGELVHVLKEFGYENVTGIDVSSEQVEKAHSNGVSNVIKADLCSYLNGSIDPYDCIIMIDVLEHFSKHDILSILEQCRRSLNKNGCVIIRVPNNAAPLGRYLQACDGTHLTALTPRSLRQYLRHSGFTSIAFFGFPPIPDRPVAVFRYILWCFIQLFRRVIWLVDVGNKGPEVITGNMGCVAKGGD